MPRKSGSGQGRPVPGGRLATASGVAPERGKSGRAADRPDVDEPFSLVTFLLGRAAIRKQQESDSAGGPKPTISGRLDNSSGA